MNEYLKFGCVTCFATLFFILSADRLSEGVVMFFLISNLLIYLFLYNKYRDEKVAKEEKINKEYAARYENERPYREQREREYRESQERAREAERKKAAAIAKVEDISMSATKKYENKNNRNPVDVSKENIGYDILSSNSFETRHIEVKGLSLDSYDSYVLLTKNEYEKAKELCNNFFLYIVSNCESDRQQLYVLKNPASILNIVYNSETNKYKILLNDVKQKVNFEYV